MTGLLLALALAGCSDESTDTAQQASSTSRPQTSSVATAAEPPAATPAPAIESEAAETPALVVPEAPVSAEVPADPAPADVPTGSDRPHGEQLYFETCQQFIEAIDALAATGVTSREQAATGISDQLQANPSWSTLPPEDQQEMLRSLDAAGRGQC